MIDKDNLDLIPKPLHCSFTPRCLRVATGEILRAQMAEELTQGLVVLVDTTQKS